MNYRLIYSDGNILALIEDQGITEGPASVFNGTAEEVRTKAKELNLQDSDNYLRVLPE